MLRNALTLVRDGVREGSRLDRFLTEFKRNKLALVGASIFIAFVFIGIFAPYLAPKDPATIDMANRWMAPTMEHPFGTDQYGRDIFSRVILGTRISLIVAVSSVTFATSIGATIGLVASYYGGKVDEVLMRLMDMLYAFPSILLALTIIATLGPGLDKVIIALGIVYTPTLARVTRGEGLSVRNEEYVLAAKSYGESALGIMRRDMFPNLMAAVMVQATVYFAFAILIEAALSFLGLGAQPPEPSWGIMISHGQDVIQRAPWVSIFPGLAIMSVVMGINFLGDGLRDALDPKTQGSQRE